MRQFDGSRCNWQTYAGEAELAGVVGGPSYIATSLHCSIATMLHCYIVVGVQCYIYHDTPPGKPRHTVQCALCVSVQAMHSNEAASLSNQWIVQ